MANTLIIAPVKKRGQLSDQREIDFKEERMKAAKRFLIGLILVGLVFIPFTSLAKGKININKATVKELQTLPGIESVIAQRIVDYRHEYGPFKKIEDLMQVKGIGKKRFERIKDLITVEEETPN